MGVILKKRLAMSVTLWHIYKKLELNRSVTHSQSSGNYSVLAPLSHTNPKGPSPCILTLYLKFGFILLVFFCH
jgi:hypothetical protein